MRELTIKATIPLPDDPFDAAAVITAAHPAIKALREALTGVKGATVSHTFDGRSSARGASATPAAPRQRKPRVQVPAPEGVANPGAANGEAGKD